MRECGELVLQKPARIDGRGPRPASLPRGAARRGRARPPAGGIPRRADPARVPGRALLRRRSRSSLAAALAGYFEAPGGAGTDRIAARRPSCAASWRRTSTSPGAAPGTRGRTAPWPRRATRTASSSWARRPRGLDGHHFAATRKAFETPFGPLEVDREVLDAIVRRSPEDLFAAELAHRGEHSIEFQAVWLQYLRHRAGGGERRIVPLLTSFVHECLARGKSPGGAAGRRRGARRRVRDAMATIPRRYCIVAGADLAHVGPRFGDGWRAGRDPAGARPVRGSRAARAGVRGGRRRILRGGAPPTGPEPDLRPVAHLRPPSAAPGRGGHAPPLRAVARSRRRGHLRQRAPSSRRGRLDDPAAPARAPALPRTRASREPSGSTARAPGGTRSVEVTHPGVLRNLYANLRVDGTGHYLQAGPFRVPVQVDDAPFVVVRAQDRTTRAPSRSI